MAHNSPRRQNARDALGRFLQQVEHKFTEDTIDEVTDLVLSGEMNLRGFAVVMQGFLVHNPGPEIINEVFDAMHQNTGSSIAASDGSSVAAATNASTLTSKSGGSNNETMLFDIGIVESAESNRQEQVHLVHEAGSQGANTSIEAYSQPQEASYDGPSDSSVLQGELISQQSMDYSSTARSPGGNPQ